MSQKWLGLGRSLLVLALVLVPLFGVAADNSAATILLIAPGAPSGAIAVVQYENPSGQWFDVTGWKAPLQLKTGSGAYYQAWTLKSDNFAQCPFRWMVYGADGQTPWAISDLFMLPRGGGMLLTLTIRKDNLEPVTTTTPVQAAVAEAAQVPVLSGGVTQWGMTCAGKCDAHAHITAFITGVPATSWVVVQWQDGLGNWQSVAGWQGHASYLYNKGQLNDWTATGAGALFFQWSVLPANYGQGPFRWAIYDQLNGTLKTVSPSFRLPTVDGANMIMTLSS